MSKSYAAATAPSHCTIYYYNNYYYYYFKRLFYSVNPILSFCTFESKKSVVVDVAIAAKHLKVANRIYIINNVFITNFHQQSITNDKKLLQIMTIFSLCSIKLKVNFTEFHLHQKEAICL